MSLFDPDRSAARAPVSLITGFLGSGKTTLLNRLLADPGMARSLVLINEFGAVGLDHHFVAAKDGDIVLLQSGCLCCTIKGELETQLRDIARRRQAAAIPPFDRVLIETTGLADPAPIMSLLLAHPFVSHDYRLDAVVATVDAVHGGRQLDAQPESVKQAALADRLVLTKTDIAAPDAAAALEARLAALNPAAPIRRAVSGAIAPADLFGAGPFDPAGRSERARVWLAAESHGAHEDGHRHDHAHGLDVNRHGARIRSHVFTGDRPLDWLAFQAWLKGLRQRHAADLLRVKGILNVAGEDRPLVVHGVHDTFHPPTLLAAWPDADRRSQLVMIVRDLDRATLAPDWGRARL
jgi:G3E family GTPase